MPWIRPRSAGEPAGGILCGFHELLLLLAIHALFVQRDQGIRYVAKRSSDGFLVGDHQLLVGSFGLIQLAAQFAAFKEWLCQ